MQRDYPIEAEVQMQLGKGIGHLISKSASSQKSLLITDLLLSSSICQLSQNKLS